MLDTKLIVDDPDKVAKAADAKNVTLFPKEQGLTNREAVEHFLEIDERRREKYVVVQTIREERNKLSEKIKKDSSLLNKEEALKLKQSLEKEETDLKAVEEEFKNFLYRFPNLPKEDVKIGKDERENEVIKTFGEIKKFEFRPKDHLDIGEALDIIDVKRASKVSGTRFAYLKKDAVLLEFALVQLALDTLIKEGFIPIVPPVLIRQEITRGLGYWQAGGNEDYYLVEDYNVEKGEEKSSPLYLVGTAEHAIVPMYKDEILNKKDLPLRFVGFSSAFRREAGSYGKDTKGILRVHQFDKVEMVSFVSQGEDDREHEYLLSLEEKLFQVLEIPYQVVKMCTGDLGFPAARKYDIEAWMPGQNTYREVTSVSTVTDFQSRRLNIKYQDEAEKKFVYILNGTAFAIGRTIIAILENYQEGDGSIVIPKVLQKYLGKEKIIPQK